MQISDGRKWHSLPAYDVPESLDGGTSVQVVDDPCLQGFRAAKKAADERTSALFRLNEDEPGQPFFVEFGRMPILAPERAMAVQVILTPAR